ncbi:MAG: type I-E CRISPR-associated protein Cas5/CasD [Olsenella sp.]|jgi:CRISPR system Cascade subunit CasD|nr:type I-E CRISPR-associated protein Cas5/CasD [Olsenella sp.]
MAVLLLELSGPLQSWGDSSRYVKRGTRWEPTKSGVVGMLASALGRSREDKLDDLSSLEYGVRLDQPGTLLVDFQTERPLGDTNKAMPLSYRYYLADAKFLVALAGDATWLQELDGALRHPGWPLFLGRRSCPPDTPPSLGVRDDYQDVRSALSSEHWLATRRYRRRHQQVTELEVACDARAGEVAESQADLPLSFSGAGRKYAGRGVYRFRIPVNQLGGGRAPTVSSSATELPDHDPMSFF